MRISGALCVLSLAAAFVFSCAESTGPSTGDDMGSGSQQQATCGDGTCEPSEIGACEADCGHEQAAMCGNSVCESAKGEDAISCSADCGAGSSAGSGSGSNGGGQCPSDLACLACLFDPASCVGGVTVELCFTCFGGSACVGGFPNGVCDAGETSANCPFDCI